MPHQAQAPPVSKRHHQLLKRLAGVVRDLADASPTEGQLDSVEQITIELEQVLGGNPPAPAQTTAASPADSADSDQPDQGWLHKLFNLDAHRVQPSNHARHAARRGKGVS